MVIIYFWWRNTQGLRESSSDALRIVQITTVMVVVLLVWAVAHAARGAAVTCRRRRRSEHIRFSRRTRSAGCAGRRWPAITAIAVLVGLGHSFLAMSG